MNSNVRHTQQMIVQQRLVEPITELRLECTEDVKMCCCIDRGQAHLSAHLDKSAYMPGETVGIISEITNTSKQDFVRHPRPFCCQRCVLHDAPRIRVCSNNRPHVYYIIMATVEVTTFVVCFSRFQAFLFPPAQKSLAQFAHAQERLRRCGLDRLTSVWRVCAGERPSRTEASSDTACDRQPRPAFGD